MVIKMFVGLLLGVGKFSLHIEVTTEVYKRKFTSGSLQAEVYKGSLQTEGVCTANSILHRLQIMLHSTSFTYSRLLPHLFLRRLVPLVHSIAHSVKQSLHHFCLHPSVSSLRVAQTTKGQRPAPCHSIYQENNQVQSSLKAKSFCNLVIDGLWNKIRDR